VSDAAVRREIAAKRLRTIHIGRRILVLPGELRRYLAEKEEQVANSQPARLP